MMKKVGIGFIVLQIIAIISGVSTGKMVWMEGAPQAIGYFLPTIIGVILIIRANGKEKKEEQTEENGTTAGMKTGTGAVKCFCPKCGAMAEDGDAFCIQCGSPLKGGK